MNTVKRHSLEITAFTVGASIMVVELTASRLLAPYVGTSFFVWTNIIGVILASLSLGYWFGGKISKKPSIETLSHILLLVGVTVLLIAVSYKHVLGTISSLYFLNLIIVSLISTVIMFALPSILFGLVSPYLARLKIKSVDESGKTVGTLYAISTLGSIVGTFATGFLLISFLGSTHILLLVAFLLIANSLFVGFSKTTKGNKMIAIIFLILCSILFIASIKPKEIETQYSTVEIIDQKFNGKDARYMIINGLNSSGILLKGDDLVFPFFHYYNLVRHFKPDFKNALMVGGAGYAYPTYLVNHNPKVNIDVVEIDPKVTELAREYFNLKTGPRLKAIHEDGRIYLNRNLKKYDAIFMDAFTTYSVPHHLVTREAVLKMNDSLTSDGVVVSNIISSLTGEKSSVIKSVYKTFKTVFPQVYLFPIAQDHPNSTQNIMLVALKSKTRPSFNNNDPYLDGKLKDLWTKKIGDDTALLTDDYAPIEQYMLKFYEDLPARNKL